MSSAAEQLPLLSYRAPNFGRHFVTSLKQFGFAAIIDHPLDSNRIERIYARWRAYFASGEAGCYPMDPERQDGYFSVQVAEHAKGFSQRDYKEYFQYYPWGRCPAELSEDVRAYYQEALRFAESLLTSVEEHSPREVQRSFSEPLTAMIKGSEQSMLRILHYPPVDGATDVLRAAPHEDINLLTILPAADQPGLELKRADGSWLSVPNHPNQVLINIGDMLQEASAGYYPSTTHRVVTPANEGAKQSRMSLPLFLHPRPEVVLSPRFTAGRYLHQRLTELGVFGLSRDSAARTSQAREGVINDHVSAL
jgi:isopenicillin N synthase-like dioxygenase